MLSGPLSEDGDTITIFVSKPLLGAPFCKFTNAKKVWFFFLLRSWNYNNNHNKYLVGIVIIVFWKNELGHSSCSNQTATWTSAVNSTITRWSNSFILFLFYILLLYLTINIILLFVFIFCRLFLKQNHLFFLFRLIRIKLHWKEWMKEVY